MDRRRSISILAWSAAVCAIGALAASAAGAEADGPRSAFGRGKLHSGIASGWGTGFSLGFAGDGDGRKVEMLTVRPRFGVGLSDELGSGWWRGNWELLVEGEFLNNFHGDDGQFWGGALLLRYNFLQGERIFPFVELGSGMGYLDFDLDDQADGFNFSPQGGVGAHFFLNDRAALNGTVRYHHISNADTKSPNNSINDVMFLLGFTVFLD